MKLDMNIANVKARASAVPAGMTQINTRLLERLRASNASLQKQVLEAQNKALMSMASNSGESQIASMKEQLSKARKTIADLEQKVKDLTSSLEASLTKTSKKDKKVFENYESTKTSDSPIKISVN